MKENTLFVEHYRPTKLDNYVGNENIKKVIKQYLDQDDIQNLCFYGPAGTGKTTLAKLIVKNLDCDYLYINASDERGIDTIRDKVTGFASTASFKSLKVVKFKFHYMTYLVPVEPKPPSPRVVSFNSSTSSS